MPKRKNLAPRSSFGPRFGPGQCRGPGRTPAPEKSENQDHPAHPPRRGDPDPRCALAGGPRLSPQSSSLYRAKAVPAVDAGEAWVRRNMVGNLLARLGRLAAQA